MERDFFDVIIVGAGLSGIGAAHRLQTDCPDKSYAILEARDAIGGTWDLFRYPGIRSDSDMYTLGYDFRPWPESKAIADGPSILRYVRQTAVEGGIDRHIRFGHRLTGASWSSTEAMWTLDVATSDGQVTSLRCRFVHLCAGYYDYANGYTPEFPGRESFKGQIIHPQHWPQDFDYTGKRVVVIGSGATAVTLVPSLTDKAAHVTMLQRSPSYIMSLPSVDRIAETLRRWLPARLAYGITRWKNVLMGMLFYWLCRHRPDWIRKLLRKGVAAQLPPDFDIDTHFHPSYNPWDQRLCMVPDGDLFRVLRSGKADIVTDHIDRFVPEGIQLKSGKTLNADVIVTATGLQLQAMGGAQLSVDGRTIELSKTMNYKGAMLSGVPNLAFVIGYTNASWTLKADLTSGFVCRLLQYMDQHGYRSCVPSVTDPDLHEEPLIDFSSGYVQRSIDRFPRQGSKRPWRLYQNYALDLVTLRFGRVDDGALRFDTPAISDLPSAASAH